MSIAEIPRPAGQIREIVLLGGNCSLDRTPESFYKPAPGRVICAIDVVGAGGCNYLLANDLSARQLYRRHLPETLIVYGGGVQPNQLMDREILAYDHVPRYSEYGWYALFALELLRQTGAERLVQIGVDFQERLEPRTGRPVRYSKRASSLYRVWLPEPQFRAIEPSCYLGPGNTTEFGHCRRNHFSQYVRKIGAYLDEHPALRARIVSYSDYDLARGIYEAH